MQFTLKKEPKVIMVKLYENIVQLNGLIIQPTVWEDNQVNISCKKK